MRFDELRQAYLKGANNHALAMPFWIINATAPKSRSAIGWFSKLTDDLSNSDMFEMTAVSHGSGRYGFVSAPPSLYGMTVLDSVAASAAFFDPSQQLLDRDNVLGRGGLGVLQHLFNFDWGADIPNYNVTDGRRDLHRVLPFPFYWLDGAYSRYLTEAHESEETQDRVRSAFIRLIDGGNSENLGVYALLKRKVRTILIADSGQDDHGYFDDMCSLANRLSYVPPSAHVPTHVYLPGLADFAEHCATYNETKHGYDLHAWPFEFPVLVGCVREDEQTNSGQACQGLNPAKDVRLLIVKPAINTRYFYKEQTHDVLVSGAPYKNISACWMPGMTFDADKMPYLNCETADFVLQNKDPKRGDCQVFPQHSTAGMTVNSSATLFGAYRELSRQYVVEAEERLGGLFKRDVTAAEVEASVAQFDAIALQQAKKDYRALKADYCAKDSKPPELDAKM
jgi:hypothetical protein